MTDALLLQERVKNSIQIGESDFREFKSAWEGAPGKKKPRMTRDICRDIGEALVAFANADGGELLIGVEDDGSITGVPHDETDINQMLQAVHTHVYPGTQLPLNHAIKLQLDNHAVLFFSVSKGTTEIYQLPDGRCIRRKDRRSVPELIERIRFDRQEIRSREYERQFVDGASVNDLDIMAVQDIANGYLRGLTVEKYLQQTGLAEYSAGGITLRMAPLLLFARDIQRWRPRSEVRILKVSGSELKSGRAYNVISDEILRGNIFELIQSSWERLRPFLAERTEFGGDAKFDQKFIYPENACREALINAIAHRDYSIHNGIEIYIFDDRLEIKSPGPLLSTLTIEALEKLEGAHESRNVLIARILRENKYMRELGEGIKRMFELMEQNTLEKPALHSNNIWFSVTLRHKSIFTEKQEKWLELFEQYPLTKNQKKIVALGMDDRRISQRDIYQAIKTRDRNTYDAEVTGLRHMNILEEFRSNVQASREAKNRGVDKQTVPRFRVSLPGANTGKNPTAKHHAPLISSVFVGNLPDDIPIDQIKQLFETCGPVERVDRPTFKPTGEPKNFCFVWFNAPEAAGIAIRELNGYVLKGKRLFVDENRQRIPRPADNRP